MWQIAGRPPAAPAEWKRSRPLVIALDNYAVHHRQTITTARPLLAAAQIEFVYLARDCPEQSGIEPVWNDVKQHHVPVRSFEQVIDLKRAVDAALACKAVQLQQAYAKSTTLQRLAT